MTTTLIIRLLMIAGFFFVWSRTYVIDHSGELKNPKFNILGATVPTVIMLVGDILPVFVLWLIVLVIYMLQVTLPGSFIVFRLKK